MSFSFLVYAVGLMRLTHIICLVLLLMWEENQYNSSIHLYDMHYGLYNVSEAWVHSWLPTLHSLEWLQDHKNWHVSTELVTGLSVECETNAGLTVGIHVFLSPILQFPSHQCSPCEPKSLSLGYSQLVSYFSKSNDNNLWLLWDCK